VSFSVSDPDPDGSGDPDPGMPKFPLKKEKKRNAMSEELNVHIRRFSIKKSNFIFLKVW
jgi:hypothetical protein